MRRWHALRGGRGERGKGGNRDERRKGNTLNARLTHLAL